MVSGLSGQPVFAAPPILQFAWSGSADCVIPTGTSAMGRSCWLEDSRKKTHLPPEFHLPEKKKNQRKSCSMSFLTLTITLLVKHVRTQMSLT